MAHRVLSHHDIVPIMKQILKFSANAKRDVVNLGQSARNNDQEPVLTRIGVCVSGGPDSMALAYLLRGLETTGDSDRRLELHGMIVDHRARPESTDEAELVQKNLSEIGLSSTILTMAWSENIKPLQLSDFESQARSKRYQLLAEEALKRRIQHLFLGHHQDDQVETVLMRMIRNQNLSLNGLAGIGSTVALPGCDNLFGAHTAFRNIYVNSPLVFPQGNSNHATKTAHPTDLHAISAPGGISLHRPLLPFPKVALVATCERNSVRYVVDPTNKDPRTSLRNAVRHLRAKHKLPRALSQTRILKLQRTAQDHLNSVKVLGEDILRRCQLVSLDIRSSSLSVKAPQTSLGPSTDVQAHAYAIAKLAEVVSPNPRSQQSFGVPRHLLCAFFDNTAGTIISAEKLTKTNEFTYNGVLFVRSEIDPQTWTLTRQPMRPREIVQNTLSFSYDKQLHLEFVSSSSSDQFKSRFLLWDNRFWVRITVDQPQVLQDITIRPFRESDMSAIRRRLGEDGSSNQSKRAALLDLIKEAAPGKLRFTLPVLAYKDQVVAFPTLQKTIGDIGIKSGLPSLEWEVRYNSFSLLDDWQKQKVDMFSS